MFSNSVPYSVPVAPISGGNSGFGGFGNDWIGLIVILAILGWGGNGFGGFGFGGGNGGYSEVQRGFDHNAVINKLDGLTYGLSDSTYALTGALNSGFNGVQQTLCQGFNGISREIADCCCATQGAIKDVRYDLATQACDTRNVIQNSTRDILESNNSNTRAILDFLVQSKMDEKDGKIAELQSELMLSRQNAFFTANQDAQTAELIRRMGRDFPVNAVVVQPNTPVTFPTNCCGQFSGFSNYGYGNNGCGCGCA